MPTRRFFLKTGAASALVAGIGTTGYAWYPGSARARAPWSDAGESLGDPRLDALAYAILAPNPHNRQPWWFELVDEDKIDVYVDLDRLLPETDPYNRQITIGFGCMLELLRQAAAEKNYLAEITPFPDGQPRTQLDGNRIAQVRFLPDAATPDPLFSHVLERRTLREPFSANKPVSKETLSSLLSESSPVVSSSGTLDKAERRTLTVLCQKGWQIEHENDATRRESIKLMRVGNREVAKNPDGISIDGTMMGLMGLTGIMSDKNFDTPGTMAYDSSLSMYDALIESAQGFVWLTTPDNSRASQLEAGRSWVRLNLIAQAQGIGLHPLSQVLQEFPAMLELYNKVHDHLAPDGGTIQMLGRIGYADFPVPAPRWPLSSRLIKSPA